MDGAIIRRAFEQLYPGKEFPYTSRVTFSARFRQYNASIVRCAASLEVRASRQWEGVNQDIFTGLIQTLLVKLFGQPIQQPYTIDLYNRFIRNVHVSIPKTTSDALLEDSFVRVNGQFFSGQVELANLKWGGSSTRKLGCYDFQTDTITISQALLGQDNRLLDYVMFHEMLHKKLKFASKKMKNYFHTSEFREWEKKFPLHEEIEHELRQLGRKGVRKNLFTWFGEKFK
ncbi:SprT-like domain-containing protein [Candidatus Woesearchaeota archaeon]|nr:SprT-like domain-containing protein [Candidatus Woesearchaeota archaeon]